MKNNQRALIAGIGVFFIAMVMLLFILRENTGSNGLLALVFIISLAMILIPLFVRKHHSP